MTIDPQTEVVELAWSNDPEPTWDTAPSWSETIGHAVVILMCCAAVAGVVALSLWLWRSDRNTPPPLPSSPTSSLPTATPAPRVTVTAPPTTVTQTAPAPIAQQETAVPHLPPTPFMCTDNSNTTRPAHLVAGAYSC